MTNNPLKVIAGASRFASVKLLLNALCWTMKMVSQLTQTWHSQVRSFC